MWTDIATGSVVIIFIGLIFKFHQAKLGKLEEKKVDKELFESTHTAISEDLKKGEKKFNQIFDIMREHGETLARIDERTLSLARKNGVE